MRKAKHQRNTFMYLVTVGVSWKIAIKKGWYFLYLHGIFIISMVVSNVVIFHKGICFCFGMCSMVKWAMAKNIKSNWHFYSLILTLQCNDLKFPSMIEFGKCAKMCIVFDYSVKKRVEKEFARLNWDIKDRRRKRKYSCNVTLGLVVPTCLDTVSLIKWEWTFIVLKQ